MQLNSFAVNANFINTTQPVNDASLPSFVPTAFAVRLNTLWFSSLVCSLLSASLGLLVKQWLREYLAGASSVSRESIRIRQFRHDGLCRWHVPEIILCLPILLQTALLLFFAGLLDLLWSLHPIVAAVVSVIIGASVLFSIGTSLIPLVHADCPYKSPQAWVLCAAAQTAKRTAASAAAHYYARLYHPGHPNTNPSGPAAHGATTPDPFASRLDLSGLVHNRVWAAARTALHRLSRARTYASWRDRELLCTSRSAADAGLLDDAALAGADAAFMDDAFLRGVVRPCVAGVGPRAALRCVEAIMLRRAPRVLNSMPYWDLAPAGRAVGKGSDGAGDGGTHTLMHLLLEVQQRLNAARVAACASAHADGGIWDDLEHQAVWEELDVELGPSLPGAGTEDARRRVLMTMHRLVRAIPAPASKGDRETRALFRRMFEVLAGVLDAEGGAAQPERFVRERSFNLMIKLFPRFQAVGPACALLLLVIYTGNANDISMCIHRYCGTVCVQQADSHRKCAIPFRPSDEYGRSGRCSPRTFYRFARKGKYRPRSFSFDIHRLLCR